jgi:hypothetical protein
MKLALWPALFVAPLAFLAELTLAYALVPYACDSQHHAVLHAVNLVTLAIAVIGTLHGWREYRVAGDAPARDAGDRGARSRFVAVTGLLVSATMVLALLAQLVTMLVIPPCVR